MSPKITATLPPCARKKSFKTILAGGLNFSHREVEDLKPKEHFQMKKRPYFSRSLFIPKQRWGRFRVQIRNHITMESSTSLIITWPMNFSFQSKNQNKLCRKMEDKHKQLVLQVHWDAPKPGNSHSNLKALFFWLYNISCKILVLPICRFYSIYENLFFAFFLI